MNSIVKTLSLVLFSSVCLGAVVSQIEVEEGTLGNKKGGETRKIEVYQNMDSKITLNNFDSKKNSLKRVRKSISESDYTRNLWESNYLMPLYDAFDSLIQKIENDEKSDIVDIILLLDSSGKTQTLTLMYFLKELEDILRVMSNSEIPRINLKLCSVVDCFVGAGYGAVPAAIGALGIYTQGEALDMIQNIPSKMISPKSLTKCCGVCGIFNKMAKSVASAYFGKPEIIDDNSPEWDSLVYDSFNLKKNGETYFMNLFDASSTADLKSSFETIALNLNNDSISGLVFGAISARDSDAKSSIKRVAVSEILSTAESVLTNCAENGTDNLKQNAEKAVNALDKIQIVLNKSRDKEGGSISDIRESILSENHIPRDLLVINLFADTFPGKIMIPSFSYDIKLTENEKKIININYKFAVPSYFYDLKKDKEGIRKDAIDRTIKKLFSDQLKKTSATQATEKLIEFLDVCNKRVLRELKQESEK